MGEQLRGLFEKFADLPHYSKENGGRGSFESMNFQNNPCICMNKLKFMVYSSYFIIHHSFSWL
jgi:hypothetical protein